MLSLAKKYESGNQRQREFCEENGIKESILNYWLGRYRKENSPKSQVSQIVPIQIKNDAEDKIKIITSGGVQIHIPI